jgi:hypothetical protein
MRPIPIARRFALALAGVLTLAGCSSGAPVGGETSDSGEVSSLLDAAADSAPDAPPISDATSDVSADATADADANASADGAVDADETVDADASADATAPPDAADTAPPDAADSAPEAGIDATTDCAPGDPTLWQLLPYTFRDGDGDTYTIPQSGTVCSGSTLPPGYSNVANGDDCDDTNPNVFVLAPVYVDVDGDGVGAGASQTMCIGTSAPPGDSLTGTDCAPADPTEWQLLPFEYRDGDGDTYTVGMSGEVCAGAALPAGYADSAKGDDCDDTNPLIYDWVTVYADTDGDGVGAGPSSLVCTNGSVPAGDSSSGTDCAPTDPTRWQMLPYGFVDLDGYTVPQTGTVCSGAALLPPYYATAHGNDCDDTNPALWQWEIVYPDNDGDGVGALPLQILCEGSTFPAGYSHYGDDEDDTNASIGPLPPEDLLGLFLN